MSQTRKYGRVLIVDDEDEIRDLLGELVQDQGYEVRQAVNGEAALAEIGRESPDVMLLDIKMPGRDGLEILRDARRLDRDLPVVMITGHATVQAAVEALRCGAHDFLVKPFAHEDVIRALGNAMAARGLRQTVEVLAGHSVEAAELRERMGPSQAVARISAAVARVAASDFTVLLVGETGTGKELVARAIHEYSRRVDGPFVAVDCGAIPETLVESELFGHEKGAFTGAERCRTGKIEAAIGGTLFLDEIANMSLAAQAKLLRALQEHRISRLGANAPIDIDTRVIVAVNEDLEAAILAGKFRKDLYFRLTEFVIHLPPLRDRRDDILFLARRFAVETQAELGKAPAVLSSAAVERLLTFDWPGNVRQLRSTIRRAVLMADATIDPEHLDLGPASDANAAGGDSAARPSRRPLRELVRSVVSNVEKAALQAALTEARWNKAKAARLLEIDYKTMHAKLREYGLTEPGGGEHGEAED